MTLREAFDEWLPQIELELQEIVHSPNPNLDAHYGMIRYHLGWVDKDLQPNHNYGGKRLRPMLCLLSCQALGGDPGQAIPAACAIELTHNFTLVHDDIQDGSRTRRGQRAVWDIWGMAHGINVGDGLSVLARLALHRLGNRGVSLPRQQAATMALDRARLAMCEGQFFDMSFEGLLNVDLDQYEGMIRRKTAALPAASTQVGAIIATDQADLIQHLYRFGENLGIAFQIQDDVLGIWGNEQLTGKSAATDLRDKKNTLPVVYTLSQTRNRGAAQRLADLYSQPGPLDEAAIKAALLQLDRVGARQYSEGIAEEHYNFALKNLEQTGVGNAALSSLREFAALILGRKT